MADVDFDELSDRIYEQIWKPPTRGIPKTVYHYTNADGLLGILNSKRVWATDCRSLNDETESQLGVLLAADVAKARALEATDGKLKSFYGSLWEYLREEEEEHNFVFSLSSEPDDLTQWRTYARDGRGFTIGFETAALLGNSQANDDHYGFSQVIYSPRKQRLDVTKYLSVFEELVTNCEFSGRKLESFIDQACVVLDWAISSQSVLFKHASFTSEGEWRVNTYPDTEPQAEVKVRASAGRLIPYVELQLCGEEQNCLPISCIGIGPGFRDSGVNFALKKLCRQTGFDVEIYNANTPYRRL